MKKLLFIIAALCLCSCNDESEKYTGIFRGVQKSSLPAEIIIKHYNQDTFLISNISKSFFEPGIRNKDRITYSFNKAILETFGLQKDMKVFYDFNQNYDRVIRTSNAYPVIADTFIRVK